MSDKTIANSEAPLDGPLHPKTEDELFAYIREMIKWPASADVTTGYGRCVYAMSYAAVATFNYIAHELGVTGFQASCADLDFLTHTRAVKHGLLVLSADDLLYPQYDLVAKARGWIAKTRPQLAIAAQELLNEGRYAHPDVVAHWEKLAAREPEPEPTEEF